MKLFYNGYLYESLNTKEAYDFASYLGKPILAYIENFRNTMVTGGKELLPEFQKYSVHNKFEIPLDEVLRKYLFYKGGKGDPKDGIFKSIMDKGYLLILDYKNIEKFNGTSKCANTLKGIDPRTVKHYIEISGLDRALGSILRTVEHELVHVYHCDQTIAEFVKSFMQFEISTLDYDHEIAANFKGIAKAIERSLLTTYINPMTKLRASIIRYNNGSTSEDSIENIKSELRSLKQEFNGIIRSPRSFIDYVRDSWNFIVTNNPNLIEDPTAERYRNIFDRLEYYVGELYNNLKTRGFFETNLKAIEGLTE